MALRLCTIRSIPLAIPFRLLLGILQITNMHQVNHHTGHRQGLQDSHHTVSIMVLLLDSHNTKVLRHIICRVLVIHEIHETAVRPHKATPGSKLDHRCRLGNISYRPRICKTCTNSNMVHSPSLQAHQHHSSGLRLHDRLVRIILQQVCSKLGGMANHN